MQAKQERLKDVHSISVELQPLKHLGNESIIAAQQIVNGFEEANTPLIFVSSYSDILGNTCVYLDSNTLLDYELYTAFEQYVKHADKDKQFKLRINTGAY